MGGTSREQAGCRAFRLYHNTYPLLHLQPCDFGERVAAMHKSLERESPKKLGWAARGVCEKGDDGVQPMRAGGGGEG